MPKKRPKNKETELRPLTEDGEKHGPKWLMGKNDKFGLHDLFRLARQANYSPFGQNFPFGQEEESGGEGNTIYEDDVTYNGLPAGAPGSGQYMGDYAYDPYTGAPLAQPVTPAAPAQPALPADPMEGFWPGQEASGENSFQSSGASFSGIPQDQVALAQQFGQQYGVDPSVLLAIAKHETGFGSLGLGRKGYTLGFGATDSGNIPKYAGVENQYRSAAADLAKEGLHTIDQIPTLGVQAYQASDPNWAKGVQSAYQQIVSQMSAPSEGSGTPLPQAPPEPAPPDLEEEKDEDE